MKKYIFVSIIGWLIATIGGTKVAAQDTPPPPPPPPPSSRSIPPPPPPPPPAPGSSQEIIIRKKGDKDKKMVIEITDGKVLIDGKSIAEFKDDEITVNNRKILVRDVNKLMLDFDGKIMDLNSKLGRLDELKGYNFNFDNNMTWAENSDYTYMGVSTEKVSDGVKITDVTDNSPASKAGLKEDDVIYKIGDKEITTTGGVSEAVRAKKAGDKVKVYFKRDGKKKDVSVTLEQKKSTATVFGYKTPKGQSKTWIMPNGESRSQTLLTPDVNMNFDWDSNRSMSVRGRPRLGIKIQDTEEGNGVKIIDVDENTPAATAGMMKDDVITEIGGGKVMNTDEARVKLSENGEKSSYTIKARRAGNEMTFTVKIPKNLKTANL